MTEDAKNLSRSAQYLPVYVSHGTGIPPIFGGWYPLFDAKVEMIEINRDKTPSVAEISFPTSRWHEYPESSYGYIKLGDAIRITSEDGNAIVFQGYVTRSRRSCHGGSHRMGAHEENILICQDIRWVLAKTSVVYGQIARGPDDYMFYGTDGQYPKPDGFTFLSGRRTVFNEDGKPNKDIVDLQCNASGISFQMPIFASSGIGEYWYARGMIWYLLSPLFSHIYNYMAVRDWELIPGLQHEDWGQKINHIVVEGLNVIEALEHVANSIGWGFRVDDPVTGPNPGHSVLAFYKYGGASGNSRDNNNTTILHELYAPAVDWGPEDHNLKDAVEDGEKIVCSLDLDNDISEVVNIPIGLGAPQLFEITVELVPAWKDDDLEPDTAEENAFLFLTEQQLREMASQDSSFDPNSHSFYKYYHARGSEFRPDVGRRWALNESGRYCKSSTYDRGVPFDFSTVVPEEYSKPSSGPECQGAVGTAKRIFAPFDRRLLPCLSLQKDTLNSVGYKVEFSFDGGETWHLVPGIISALPNECGIYIEEPNLAEMSPQQQTTINCDDPKEAECALKGIELNYWTSLVDDKLEERVFKDKEKPKEDPTARSWKTRIRVTASIQMDQRLRLANTSFDQASNTSTGNPLVTNYSGSPFYQVAIFDMSRKYGLAKRTKSSVFGPPEPPADPTGRELPVTESDDSAVLNQHLEFIKTANQDMSISGRFTLDRLWLGDGENELAFMIGDEISKIKGREFSLLASMGGEVYPEIAQIIYFPSSQMMQLITRDLRFARVNL
jgi:hypothetical protein